MAELVSAGGRLRVAADGRIEIERDGRVVLTTAPSPMWGEVYGVELGAVGLVSTDERGDSLTLRYATSSDLSQLTLEVEAAETGFRLILAGPATLPTVGLRLMLQPGGPWYGLGERVVQTWPLDVAQVISQPLMPYDHADDGTLNICTPLLLGAAGVGLLVEETGGTLGLTINRSGDGQIRLAVRAPEIPFGAEFDAIVERPRPRLAVDILLAPDIPAAFAQALRFLGHPTSAPPAEVWAKPIWTTWARYKMGVSQATVLQFADEIVGRGYPRSVLEIDDRWQSAYGDLAFDREKFPDPAAMIAALHDQGFKVTLWVPPFFAPDSVGYADAAARGFLVQHPATGAPFLTRWWQGFGGLLDVSNPAALDWWLAGLQRLQRDYGVDGFKFDGAESNFVPPDARFAFPLDRRHYGDRYIAWIAQHFSWTEVRTGWRSQRAGILFRQWDKWSRWGLDNGLHSVLTQALTMSLIGYPFILPDMIGGNAYGGELPDRELLIRWTQLTALLPAMQFSIPPWQYDDEADAICRRWVKVHADLAPYLHSLIDQTLRDGTPIIRPLFWHHPDDQVCYTVNDQFLLGDLLLVAPVLAAGATSRSVYLPAGRWRDRWDGTVFEGPQRLTNYPAPLDKLPVFERLDRAEAA